MSEEDDAGPADTNCGLLQSSEGFDGRSRMISGHVTRILAIIMQPFCIRQIDNNPVHHIIPIVGGWMTSCHWGSGYYYNNNWGEDYLCRSSDRGCQICIAANWIICVRYKKGYEYSAVVQRVSVHNFIHRLVDGTSCTAVITPSIKYGQRVWSSSSSGWGQTGWTAVVS